MLEYTNQTELFYVGHSMGSTGFMVMANERPDLLQHIKLSNLLAPVAYMSHMESPIKHLAFMDGPAEVGIAVKVFFPRKTCWQN